MSLLAIRIIVIVIAIIGICVIWLIPINYCYLSVMVIAIIVTSVIIYFFFTKKLAKIAITMTHKCHGYCYHCYKV